MEAKVDLTAKLPDEQLCQVLRNVTSLADQLRLTAVNKKFRRCVFNEMKKPQPLEMGLGRHSLSLSGDQIPLKNCLPAIGLLARKARFSAIDIHLSRRDRFQELLSNFFHTFAANPNCLSHVTEIVVSLKTDSSDLAIGTASALASVISKCSKLSVLDLDFTQEPVHTEGSSPMDLVQALEDKPITNFSVRLTSYSQQQLIDLFRAIKSNTLRKLNIWSPNETVSLVGLVRELCLTAAQSVEEIDIGCESEHPADLFACIAHLPALRSLSTTSHTLQHPDQFNAALNSLLSNHARATPLFVQHVDYEVNRLPCCQILTRIRELEVEMPELVFGFDQNMEMLKISLGNVTVGGLHRLRRSCGKYDCHDCRSCYPVVVDSLYRAAHREAGCRLRFWLDRCKIPDVSDKLNEFGRNYSCHWVALPAKSRGRQRATITFQRTTITKLSSNKRSRGDDALFEVTVNTGRCFDRSCVQC